MKSKYDYTEREKLALFNEVYETMADVHNGYSDIEEAEEKLSKSVLGLSNKEYYDNKGDWCHDCERHLDDCICGEEDYDEDEDDYYDNSCDEEEERQKRARQMAMYNPPKVVSLPKTREDAFLQKRK